MPVSYEPILIVNADDFGCTGEMTDRTMEAFAASRISSATAMVHMDDTVRAAERALEEGLPVGLHLNLTDPFTDPSVPSTVRERQLQVCRQFSPRRWRIRSWSFDPRIRKTVDGTVADQLEQFERSFGGPPTHVDGHKHVQACPNVSLASPLDRVGRMRDALGAWPSLRSTMAAARAARRALAMRRFLRTHYFLDIAQLYRELDRSERANRISLARRTSVEVMAHPGFGHEREALMSDDWAALLDGVRVGSYGDLAAR